MADILSLEGRTRAENEREDIVNCLLEWLELAKKGDLQDLAMVCIVRDGRAMLCAPRTGNSIQLLGAVTYLESELIKSIDEE